MLFEPFIFFLALLSVHITTAEVLVNYDFKIKVNSHWIRIDGWDRFYMTDNAADAATFTGFPGINTFQIGLKENGKARVRVNIGHQMMVAVFPFGEAIMWQRSGEELRPANTIAYTIPGNPLIYVSRDNQVPHNGIDAVFKIA